VELPNKRAGSSRSATPRLTAPCPRKAVDMPPGGGIGDAAKEWDAAAADFGSMDRSP